MAFVGPSGAGKTTIVYLAPRLHEASDGAVLFSGADVRRLTHESVIDHIGIVSQETYLFHATIAENLRYAKPDATDAELEAACRAANIHDTIASFEDGYDTVVGERGYRLSRRGEAADRDRPGAPQGPAGAPPRRGDVLARHRVGEGGPGRARRGRPRAHDASRSPTDSRPSGTRTSSTCSRPGASSSPALTGDFSRRGGLYARLAAEQANA